MDLDQLDEAVDPVISEGPAGPPRFGNVAGIQLFEHRRAPRRREIALHLIGE